MLLYSVPSCQSMCTLELHSLHLSHHVGISLLFFLTFLHFSPAGYKCSKFHHEPHAIKTNAPDYVVRHHFFVDITLSTRSHHQYQYHHCMTHSAISWIRTIYPHLALAMAYSHILLDTDSENVLSVRPHAPLGVGHYEGVLQALSSNKELRQDCS